jgi:outer membrane protein assembly factor BamB
MNRKPRVGSIRSGLILGVGLLAVACRDAAAAEKDLCNAGPGAWPQYKADSRRTADNPAARLAPPLRRTMAVRFPKPIYASPAVRDDFVYVQDARGHMACLDRRRNAAVWTASLGGFNNTSSPAVAHGKVYVGSMTGKFFVLDAATGKVLKEVPAEGGVLAAPAVINDAVYFSTFNGKLIKINPAGNVIWTFDGGRISITELAASEKEIVFFAGTDNTIFYRLRDCGEKVEVIAKIPCPGQACPHSGPTIVAESRFVFQSFDSEFGNLFLGTQQIGGDVHDGRGGCAVRGRTIYRGDKCIELDLTEPEPATGKDKKLPKPAHKPLWRTDMQELYDGGSHSSPALAAGVQVVGSERGVVWFHPLDGSGATRKAVWKYETSRADQPNGAVSSSPAVVDGAVYVGGEDGILYGLESVAEGGPKEDCPIVDLPLRPDSAGPKVKLKGHEWPFPGGDAGFSCVAPETAVKPPFSIAWKTRVWSTYKGPMIVADGKVFCGGRSGSLTTLDAATGEILWRAHHPGVESRPAPTYHQGKLLIMRTRAGQGDSPHVVRPSGGPSGQGLWCHDAETGRVLWRHDVPFAYHFNLDGLCANDGKVFLCEADEKKMVSAVALDVRDGRVVWRLPVLGPIDGKRLPRFAGAMVDSFWCVAVSNQSQKQAGATLAIDTKNGVIVWKKDGLGLDDRTLVAARNGTLVVFNKDGAHAFEALTGKPLWIGVGDVRRHRQALTDGYLSSEGKEHVFPGGCRHAVYVSGLWYLHDPRSTFSSNFLVAQEAAPAGGKPKIVWQHGFLSNACPSPSPAYESLYYSPNAEGVVYRFVPEVSVPWKRAPASP